MEHAVDTVTDSREIWYYVISYVDFTIGPVGNNAFDDVRAVLSLEERNSVLFCMLVKSC